MQELASALGIGFEIAFLAYVEGPLTDDGKGRDSGRDQQRVKVGV